MAPDHSSTVSPTSRPTWHGPGGILTRRSDEAELLDLEGHDPAELKANLADIRKANRLGGGTAVVLRHLPGLVCRVPRGQPVEVLDLATGSADIPRAILDWSARNSRPLRLTVSDHSPAILEAARKTLAGSPGVAFALHDARAVPLPDGAFDVVLCSLTLHHFAPPDAVRLLREMDRLARVGFILNDLRRCMAGYLAAWLASRLVTRNRLTRHDAPLSVRRAYTPRELRAMLAEAGVADVTITTHPLFRLAAVQRKRQA